jgi:hypothetical protein
MTQIYASLAFEAVIFVNKLLVRSVELVQASLQTSQICVTVRLDAGGVLAIRFCAVQWDEAGDVPLMLFCDTGRKTVEVSFRAVVGSGIESVRAGGDTVEGFVHEIVRIGTALIAEKTEQPAPKPLIDLPGLVPVAGKQAEQGVKFTLPEVEASFH